MPEIRTRVANVTFDSLFKKAVLFKDAHVPDLAAKCLEAFGSYGLKPGKIDLRNRDFLFDYELAFSLFGGNGEFSITAERLHVAFQNLVSEKDLEIATDCVAKVYEHLPLSEFGNTLINANAQASMSPPARSGEYLARYAKPGVLSSGTVDYIRVEHWPYEIRMSVEKSLSYADDLFLAWTTTSPDAKIGREMLLNVKSAFEEAVAKVDLTFHKA